ncbi:MAG: hypothetical protein PVF83_09170 [Anaerolineales bacterium]
MNLIPGVRGGFLLRRRGVGDAAIPRKYIANQKNIYNRLLITHQQPTILSPLYKPYLSPKKLANQQNIANRFLIHPP